MKVQVVYGGKAEGTSGIASAGDDGGQSTSVTERQTIMGPVHDRTLIELFQHQVAFRAEEPAMFRRINGQWVPMTWAEYAAQARAFAAYLVSSGLGAGGHLAIWSFNRPEFVVASTATMLAGASSAPLYQTLSADEAAYVLNHSEASIAVVESQDLLAKLRELRNRLPALKGVVLLEGTVNADDADFVISWSDALHRGAEVLSDVAHELDARREAIRSSDVATLVYTSGTTGPPKAVMATHGNLIAAIDAIGPIVMLSPRDRVLSYLPLAHILERLNSEVRLYYVGSPLWFASSLAAMPGEVHELRPTCFVGVPRVWEKMAVTINATIDAMPSLRRRLVRWAIGVGEDGVDRSQRGESSTLAERFRHVIADHLVLHRIRVETGLDRAHTLITGAAPISTQVLRFFHSLGLEIREGYGMSENMTVTAVNRPGATRLGTVGKAVPGIDVRIAEDGEILMRGDVVFAGYFKDPQATAETVIEGWLHTGDIGELDVDGYLRITDRKKDLIITAGGKNISPNNIESALRSSLIANPVVIGDRRPYLTALLALDLKVLERFAAEHGLGTETPDLLNHPVVHDAVQSSVDAVNRRLAKVEQVRRWALLPREFSVGVELTPTFKIRRKVVAERYADQIDQLYASSPSR
ncbi:MAG: long-chain fatty acid--CoA ligase [Candidatus Dormiibacterota bacterium]